MKGISHVLTGIATAIIIDTTIRAISIDCNSTFYNDFSRLLHEPFAALFPTTFSQTVSYIIIYTINIAAFIIGCLLPDCDSEKSIMGRIVHIPVKHRTWTHTIWCVVVFTLMGFAVPCFFWLAYGYTLHIFFDSMSKCGVCWFYPISQYKIWNNGAQVKKNHKFYLYRTGKASETVLLVIWSSVGTVMMMYSIYLSVTRGSLPFHAEWIAGSNLP